MGRICWGRTKSPPTPYRFAFLVRPPQYRALATEDRLVFAAGSLDKILLPTGLESLTIQLGYQPTDKRPWPRRCSLFSLVNLKFLDLLIDKDESPEPAWEKVERLVLPVTLSRLTALTALCIGCKLSERRIGKLEVPNILDSLAQLQFFDLK